MAGGAERRETPEAWQAPLGFTSPQLDISGKLYLAPLTTVGQPSRTRGLPLPAGSWGCDRCPGSLPAAPHVCLCPLLPPVWELALPADL